MKERKQWSSAERPPSR